jgi:transcriptional regulator with XRE-family HTH domain
MSDLVQFAAEVRAARAVLGWSQTELARRTAVTQRAIYCIEQNIVQPRKQTEERIIEAFTDAGLRFERLSSGGFKLRYRLLPPFIEPRSERSNLGTCEKVQGGASQVWQAISGSGGIPHAR